MAVELAIFYLMLFMAYNSYKPLEALKFRSPPTASMPTLPSLGDTKYEILLLLLDGESTGEGLTRRMKMNLSVVRRHLDDMGANKLVESSFKREGKGRPRKYYRLTAEGRTAISAKYEVVADLLTVAITKDMGPGKAKDLFGSAGRVLAVGAGKKENTNSLLPVLKDFGFQPLLRKEGDKQLIISRNCPIIKLAQKYPELTCDNFHTVFLREVLNKPGVTLRQAIARGATECIHEAPA
jgi:DeoR family suf operon transcriptional repressor